MEKKYLIDTNILIYFLAGQIPQNQVRELTKIFTTSFNISVITKIELLGWKKHTKEGFTKSKEFINSANILFIDDDITMKTIDLKQKENIKLPDAVIAATCIVGDYILVTRNVNDFDKIAGLRIFNPFEESKI